MAERSENHAYGEIFVKEVELMGFGNQDSQGKGNRGGSTPAATGKPANVQGGLATWVCRKQDPYSQPMLIGFKRSFKKDSPHLVSGHQYPKTH